MQQQTSAPDFRTLAIDQLRESPTNPRRSFDEGKLQELAQSIRAQGVLVPLIVRPTGPNAFEVVAGARRFRAALLAELFAVPARVVELSDAEALTLQLVENAIREDVHPYEEAMAYRALLESSEPRYDVASLALKTGRSVNHIYGRLRMTELIPEAAEVFQANQITAGHAVLIARLPQEQQVQALKAAFRTDWSSKEKHAISVRELGQWILENLMLTLTDAAFDLEDAELVPAAGACITCSKRTGANTALFDDFQQDDRCLDGDCFRSKIDAHIAREKGYAQGLVQITRGYYSNNKSGEKVLTRNEYTAVEQANPCSKATNAIVVEGPGKRGEIVQVCTDPECEVHGHPEDRDEREAATLTRQEEWKRQEQEREANRKNNLRLFDSVLERIPATLTRDDFEMLVITAIDRLEYEDWEAMSERHDIEADENSEPDAAAFELRKKAQKATEPQLIRMLIEIALLRFGYSDEELEPTNALVATATRYAAARSKSKKALKNRSVPQTARATASGLRKTSAR
jgi:ParB family transcriptional regulator, chromosome partitioning protein